MEEEIVASPTDLAIGENESDDKEFAIAVAVEKEETSDRDAAAESADRDLAMERLIQATLIHKEMRLSMERNISEIKANLALQQSEIEAARLKLTDINHRPNIIKDLEPTIKRFREKLERHKQKTQNIDNAAPAEEEALRSQLVDVKERSLQNRDTQGDVSGSIPQALALGIASAVGVAAGTLGTLVCLYVAKRK